MSNKKFILKLTDKQIRILEDEGTEAPGSSILNNEKKGGVISLCRL